MPRAAPSWAAVSRWSGLVTVLVGCAPMPAPSPPPPPPAQVATHDSAGPPPSPAPVVVVEVDSLPTPEALEVLGTIPEPLAPEELFSPPGSSSGAPERDAEGDAAGGRGDPTSDSSRSQVPVPAPTSPLGDPAARRPSATGSALPPVNPPAVPSPSRPSVPSTPAPSAPVAPTDSDTCWRVQVAAPEELEEAEGKRTAAESILLVPMVVQREGRLHKVRTRECLDGTAAARLRDRAVQSGFAGAFRVVTPRP